MLRSWLVFEGPIRSALHTLKYRRNLPLGDSLAQQMAPYVRAWNWPIDIVVPVPLGRKRMRERGYNQVALVAMPLAALNGWQYRPRALVRSRETRSQVGLNAEERRQNVADAFYAKPADVSGKVVLLMDDVATTGATLSACTEALKKAGAREVYALTIARALPHHGLHIV
jgi:ComF family protein